MQEYMEEFQALRVMCIPSGGIGMRLGGGGCLRACADQAGPHPKNPY